MIIIKKPITVNALRLMAKARFGNLVKVVVDVNKKIMAIDAELHADEEAVLLANGSRQEDLWGINLYPDLSDRDFIEFDSMINVRPSQKNISRNVKNPTIRKQIAAIVKKLIIL